MDTSAAVAINSATRTAQGFRFITFDTQGTSKMIA